MPRYTSDTERERISALPLPVISAYPCFVCGAPATAANDWKATATTSLCTPHFIDDLNARRAACDAAIKTRYAAMGAE